jgi:hypothetical protein
MLKEVQEKWDPSPRFEQNEESSEGRGSDLLGIATSIFIHFFVLHAFK